MTEMQFSIHVGVRKSTEKLAISIEIENNVLFYQTVSIGNHMTDVVLIL